jgi:hypothetical protein
VANAAGGNLPYSRFQTVETLNPANPKSLAPGTNVTARLNVGEDLSQAGPVSLKLRLQFKTAVQPQFIEVACNDHPLTLLSTNQTWLEYSVSQQVVHQLTNRIKVTLAAAATKATWTDLMLEVRHPSKSKSPGSRPAS